MERAREGSIDRCWVEDFYCYPVRKYLVSLALMSKV